KRKTNVVDAGEPSHPAKKLRGDYGVPGVPVVGVTNATTATPTADPAAIAKERLVGSSVFGGDSSFAGGIHPISSGFLSYWWRLPWRVVPLLSVTPDRSSSKLKASMDKLFDEGGSGEQVDQGDFTGGSQALLEAEIDMKKATEAKKAKLVKELEKLRALFSDLQVSNDRLSQQHCAEMDARLDALSIDFDEELYPYMLTAITSRRWVTGHGLRLAFMKCGESTELRHVFADVVPAWIAKGMSERLKYVVEHGKENLDLEAIEAYEPEADIKYVAALHALRDLKYLKIRELHPSSSQLKIPVYPEVRNPKDPWSYKEEILLVDAIAANDLESVAARVAYMSI
nr:hypothetical protein [Tanacetum cinerariifolium]